MKTPGMAPVKEQAMLQYTGPSSPTPSSQHTKPKQHFMTQQLSSKSKGVLKNLLTMWYYMQPPLQRPTCQTFRHRLRWNSDGGDKIAKAMGGKLNPLKCCSLLYRWVPDKQGILQLWQPELLTTFISINTDMTQKDIHPQKSSRYIMADWNMQPMEIHLWNKSITYTTAFHWAPMSQQEAVVLYWSCFYWHWHTHYWLCGSLILSSNKVH